MSNDASIPKALYQANIDLALRIAGLLQENGKQWFDLFAEEASARLNRGLSPAELFEQGLSPERLASLPADMAAQLLKLDTGRWEALMSSAVQHQARFVQGVHEALGEWRASLGAALPESMQIAASDIGDAPGVSEMMDRIRDLMKDAAPAAATAASERENTAPAKPRPASKTSATKAKPAARKATVKRATVKKAASKQPPAKKAAAKRPVVAKKATTKKAVAKSAVKKTVAKKAVKTRATKLATPVPPMQARGLSPQPVGSQTTEKKSD